jgi:hypothetical protein
MSLSFDLGLHDIPAHHGLKERGIIRELRHDRNTVAIAEHNRAAARNYRIYGRNKIDERILAIRVSMNTFPREFVEHRRPRCEVERNVVSHASERGERDAGVFPNRLDVKVGGYNLQRGQTINDAIRLQATSRQDARKVPDMREVHDQMTRRTHPPTLP